MAADGIGEKFIYATNGLVYYTNRDSQATQYGRDAAMRATSETNALLQVTQFGYDAANDLTSLVDGLGHTTSWNYSQYGWLTNKLDNNGNPIIIYTYDVDGRLTNRWMVGTNNTGYAYDNVGNRTSVTYSNAQPVTLSYSYDALNRLTNMSDAVGTDSLTYTGRGQLQTETETGTLWSSDTVSNSYSQGHRVSLSLTQPSGSWSQTYTYDSAWRLHTVASTPGTFTYGYGSSPSALVQSIALPNSAIIANSYDNLARLQSTELLNQWGHVLDGYTYAYDLLGQRTGITRNFGLGYNNVSVGYDPIGEITNWTATEVSGTVRQNELLGYGYDAAGNLHLRTNGALVETFTVGVSNQIQTVARTGNLTVSGALTAPATSLTVNGTNALVYSDLTFASTNNTLANGGNTFTVIAQDIHGASATNVIAVNLPTSVGFLYDGNGNLTNDGTRSFVYDVENQLTNVFVTGVWRVDFIYDGLGRRRVTREYSWGGSTWTRTNEIHYICDGNLVLQERDSNNTVQVTYTRGLDLSGSVQGAGGIGGLLARTDANGSTFYHADANGNVTALMDGGENIVARAEYDAFGRFLKLSGPMATANRLWFSSKELEPVTGDYYFGHRFYEPLLSRWLNRDPIGERGGANLYGFVGNSPLGVVDPFGWQSCTNSGHKNWAYRLGHALGSLAYGNPGGPPPDSYAALRDEELGPSGVDFADLVGVTADVAASVAETAAPLLIPGGGIAEETGAEVVEVAEAAETTLSSDIVATFSGGKYTSTVLQQDLTAYRYSGGISQASGRFLTTADTVSQISSPVSASIALNLPVGATAQTLNAFTIPAGTQIFTGGVAGGADTVIQIFIHNPSVLIPR